MSKKINIIEGDDTDLLRYLCDLSRISMPLPLRRWGLQSRKARLEKRKNDWVREMQFT